MKEIREIIAAYETASARGLKTALATVVRVEGSAYRREGARMLVAADGRLTGAISGGCLEGDALRKALHVIAQDKAMLVTYDTNDEADAQVGVQLGCNGVIDILIEPTHDHLPNNPIQLLREAVGERRASLLLTGYNPLNRAAAQPGTQRWNPSDPAPAALTEAAANCLHERRHAVVGLPDGSAVLLAYLPPAPALVVFGAGNDVIPVTRMAEVLGWVCTVVDGRPALARADRFPAASRVLVAKPAEAMAHLPWDDRTYALLMTHNYNYEKELLPGLLALNLPYIGILGPRKKYDRLLSELAEETDFHPTAAQLAAVHAPVGLDIGAEGAEGIALSVMAEIQAVITGREGGHLRLRNRPIHGG